jgi:hypothetical protein
MSRSLKRVFAALGDLRPPPEILGAGHVFAATKYPGSKFHRLGKDAHGHVAVLLALDPSHHDGPMAPFVLDNLSVLHAATCKVSNITGAPEAGLYTVVTCTSDDKILVRHFVTLMSSLVLSLAEQPSGQSAAAAIQQTIRLFRALRRPSSRSIQGLWAELFVIREASDPKTLVRAWRADPLEQFDFAHSNERLEVKSTKWQRRSHLFSHSQLRPGTDVRVVVASVRVSSLNNGCTLARLWHDVRSQVEDDPDLLLHVDQVVTTSLGRAWRRGLEVAFDENGARATLAFYAGDAIPSIQGNQPAELSEIHFRCDISQAVPLSINELRIQGPLAEATYSVHGSV